MEESKKILPAGDRTVCAVSGVSERSDDVRLGAK